jgi:hypothetical protein
MGLKTAESMETKLSELILKHPDRWRQAVQNPALRGWFVRQLVGRDAPMQDRLAALKIIESRATD